MLSEEYGDHAYRECQQGDNPPIANLSGTTYFGCMPWLLACSSQKNALSPTSINSLYDPIIHDEVFNPLIYSRESSHRSSSISSLFSLINDSASSSSRRFFSWLLRLPYKDSTPLAYDVILSVSFSLTFMGVWSLSHPKLIDNGSNMYVHNHIWGYVDFSFVVILAVLSLMHRRLVVNALMAKSDCFESDEPSRPPYLKSIHGLALILRLSEFYKLYWVTYISLVSMDSSGYSTQFFPWVSGLLGAIFWNNDADQRMSFFLHQLKDVWREPILYQDHNVGGFRLLLPPSFEWTAQTNRFNLSIYSSQTDQPVLSDSLCNIVISYSTRFFNTICDLLFIILDQNYLNAQDILYSFTMAISAIGFSIAMSQFVALVFAVIYEHCLDHEVKVHQDAALITTDSCVFALVFFGNILSHALIKTNEIPRPDAELLKQNTWPVSGSLHRVRQLLDTLLLVFHSVVARSIPSLLAIDMMTGMTNQELSCNRLFPEGFGLLVIILVILSNIVLDLVFPQDVLRQVMSKMTDTVPYLQSESRYALLSLPESYTCQEEVAEHEAGRVCRVVQTPF